MSPLSTELVEVLKGKSEKSVIISTVSGKVTYREGKPHLVQGMHGGMETVIACYPIPAAAQEAYFNSGLR